jgi:lauroyl/myristoyl acyltransferase
MNVLRKNGFLGIMIDSQAEPGDLSKPSVFEFLGHRAELVPGAGVIALAAGAPLIVVLLRRSADWRHQVLEIAPPLYVEGDPVAAYAKCLALVESAVRSSPSQWNKLNPTDLVQMRLVHREDVSRQEQQLMAT